MSFKKFLLIFYKNNEEVYRNTFKNNIKNDNKLEFNMLDYYTIINLKEETFFRENEEFIFFLDIKNKKCQLNLKEENITFDVSVEECNISFYEEKVIIEYFIETDEARNKIVIEKSD